MTLTDSETQLLCDLLMWADTRDYFDPDGGCMDEEDPEYPIISVYLKQQEALAADLAEKLHRKGIVVGGPLNELLKQAGLIVGDIQQE